MTAAPGRRPAACSGVRAVGWLRCDPNTEVRAKPAVVPSWPGAAVPHCESCSYSCSSAPDLEQDNGRPFHLVAEGRWTARSDIAHCARWTVAPATAVLHRTSRLITVRRPSRWREPLECACRFSFEEFGEKPASVWRDGQGARSSCASPPVLAWGGAQVRGIALQSRCTWYPPLPKTL